MSGGSRARRMRLRRDISCVVFRIRPGCSELQRSTLGTRPQVCRATGGLHGGSTSATVPHIRRARVLWAEPLGASAPIPHAAPPRLCASGYAPSCRRRCALPQPTGAAPTVRRWVGREARARVFGGVLGFGNQVLAFQFSELFIGEEDCTTFADVHRPTDRATERRRVARAPAVKCTTAERCSVRGQQRLHHQLEERVCDLASRIS